jgi:hypothetical protein
MELFHNLCLPGFYLIIYPKLGLKIIRKKTAFQLNILHTLTRKQIIRRFQFPHDFKADVEQ